MTGCAGECCAVDGGDERIAGVLESSDGAAGEGGSGGGGKGVHGGFKHRGCLSRSRRRLRLCSRGLAECVVQMQAANDVKTWRWSR